jgi:hypothetical protein
VSGFGRTGGDFGITAIAERGDERELAVDRDRVHELNGELAKEGRDLLDSHTLERDGEAPQAPPGESPSPR